MRWLLANPELCGWPPERITVFANPISAADLLTDIVELADTASGALLLYYVGHGVLSGRGELCLTVTSTHPDRPETSGLPWNTLADVLRTAQAISEKNPKAHALAAAARALAPTDPSRASLVAADAERIAQSIASGAARASALAAVTGPLAAYDADRAETVAQSIPEASFRASALAGASRSAGRGDDPVLVDLAVDRRPGHAQ